MTEWVETPFLGYSVSDSGYVRGPSGKVLKPWKASGGYLKVSVHYNGKRKVISVHRLVADAFLENPNGLSDVNHIDRDKNNNSKGNLEWATHEDNCSHSGGVFNLISPSGDVYSGIGIRKLCREFGLNRISLRKLMRGEVSSYKGWVRSSDESHIPNRTGIT